MLRAEGLTVRYGSLTILDGVDFALAENQWLMVVGPNGAGKSTLVAAVTGGAPYTGGVWFEDADIKNEKPRSLAQKLGVLMQNHMVGYAYTVEEVVRLGRYAWGRGFLAGGSDADEEKVEAALETTGLAALRGQSVLTLSGGELQRTFLAQVLAQDPRLLVLDEPANHLDLQYQRQVFGLINAWRRQPGKAVLSVVHDLSLAKAYGTHALLLNKGRRVALGAVGAVLTRENLERVYGMDVVAWQRQMLGQWLEG